MCANNVNEVEVDSSEFTRIAKVSEVVVPEVPEAPEVEAPEVPEVQEAAKVQVAAKVQEAAEAAEVQVAAEADTNILRYPTCPAEQKVKEISHPRLRLRIPRILPRCRHRVSKSPKIMEKKTEPRIMEEFQSLVADFIDHEDYEHIYSEKIVHRIRKIGSQIGDDEAFNLLGFLLHKIEGNMDQKTHKNPHYWWLTFFYCLDDLSPSFFNNNIDITALILLKCYEFLTLKTDDDSGLRNLQETLEGLTDSLVKKIDQENRDILITEILSGNLPCSILHQYDSSSLDHYLLKMRQGGQPVIQSVKLG